MRTALIIAVSLLAVASAAAGPLERLRNASANELCWDTSRGFAREKYPSVKLGDAVPLTRASLTTPIGQSIRESRKSFSGIRNC